jgi:hypothetical protein
MEVTVPRPSARLEEGMTALEHIPAKVPQNKAFPSLLSKTNVHRTEKAADAKTFVYCL